jgi:NAD(P)-dependent dehydrogenase (short-subunit alcohol dehydrogenase family)
MALPADVTDYAAITQVVAATESQLGPIELLINCAGSFRALGSAAVIDPDEWWREVEINLGGPFVRIRAVLPGMIARGRGRIINVASAAGLQAIPTVSAYCISKTALIRLTEALAAETQPYGIAILAVNPGTMRTPMSDYVLSSPQVQERAPMVQRWFQQIFHEGGDTPIEQAVAFVFAVASGRADALSGCYLSVDDDLEALIAEAETIQNDGRLTLRLRA